MKKISLKSLSIGQIALLILVVVCLNVIGSRLFFRADLTEDKIYSLSEGTRNILATLDNDITAKFYFSRSIKTLPPMIKTYASRVEEVLREYSQMSSGHFQLEVYDPKPDTDDEEMARKFGLTPMRISAADEMYFGVVFQMGKKEQAIPVFDHRREEFLEYDLSEAIVQIQRSALPKIGILSSLPVLGAATPSMPGMPSQGGAQAWAVAEQLKRNFEVSKVEPNAKEIAADLGVLILVHPKNLPDETLYAIDQYLLQGGRIIVAVDPFSRVDLAANGQMARMSRQMPQTSSDFKKLFSAWGIGYDSKKLVGDLNRMVSINAGTGPISYPYFISIREDVIQKDSVITQKLKTMLFAEGGAFKITAKEGLKSEVLLQTTEDSGFGDAAMAAFMGPADLARQMKPEKGAQNLSVLLTGTFESAFASGRPVGSEVKGQHLAKGAKEGAVLVIGDVDFMHDNNSVEKFRFGPRVMMRPRNDNLNFVLNAVEFLGGSDELIKIRSSGKITRPFTKVEELQKVAQQRWKDKEEQLSKQLTELQAKLKELQGQKTAGGRFALSAQQQAEIVKFREGEVQIRKQRRQVRKNLRESIESLGNGLVAANMMVVPLFIGCLGFGVFFRRARRLRRKS